MRQSSWRFQTSPAGTRDSSMIPWAFSPSLREADQAGGPFQVGQQGVGQCAHIPLAHEGQNVQMLKGTLFDIVQSFKGEQLILLHAGIVIAQNRLEIVVLASLHNQLMQLPVQIGELSGVRGRTVQAGAKPRLQAVDLLVGDVEHRGFDRKGLQKTAHLVEVLHILGGGGLHIGSDSPPDFHPSLAGQDAQGLPHRGAAHVQLLSQLTLAEDIAGGNLPLAQGVFDLLIGALRQVWFSVSLSRSTNHSFHIESCAGRNRAARGSR